MFYGRGDGQHERLSKESELTRPIEQALYLVAFVGIGLVVLFVEMALIGRQMWLIAPAGYVLGLVFSERVYNEEEKRYEHYIKNGWWVVVVVGVAMLGLALVDAQASIWPPVWWQLSGDGRLWVAIGDTSGSVPAFWILPRFIVALTLASYYPIFVFPAWRFIAEIMFPQLANVRFRALTLEGLRVPFFGGLVEQLEEMEQAQRPLYSERWIYAHAKEGQRTRDSRKGGQQNVRVVRVYDDVATEEQLRVLADGVLNDGVNFSRSHWTKVKLFTDHGWRKFCRWMLDEGNVTRNGNNYELTDAGKDMLQAYL